MAKLNYVEGDYKEALNIYARGGLDDLPLTAVPPYRLRLIAEAYATKGEPAPSLPGGRPPGPRCPAWSLQANPCPGLAVPSKALGWSPPRALHSSGLATLCFLRASGLQFSPKQGKAEHGKGADN